MHYSSDKTSQSGSSSHSQQQQYQFTQSIPIYKLIPANQILSKDVKGDLEQVKIIINYEKYQRQSLQKEQHRHLDRKYEIKGNMVQKMCFEEQDYLGYEYQHLFQQNLIYARTMGLPHKEWQTIITSPLESSCKRDHQKTIKYLGGLFIKDKNIVTKISNVSQVSVYDKPHLLVNNLCFLSQCEQKNYFPNLISFSANYPSANLMYVFRTNVNQFSLILHNDTNSKGSTQWFNFKVTLPSNHSFQTIKFNIVNLTKSSSIFLDGMKVLYKPSKNKQWKRLNSHIEYFENNIRIEGRKSSIKYKTLSFVYNASKKRKNSNMTSNSGQSIFFAYGYPYNFQDNYKFWSDVLNEVSTSKKNKSRMNICREVIGNSSSGLPIQVYKLYEQQKQKSSSLTNHTSSSHQFSSKSIQSNNHKSVIFLARQHPGETQSSYILEGIVQRLINFQLSTNPNFSKNNHIFYFIPIVNCEGVLFGNYRTNINGYDLNRNWRNPVKEAQPQVVIIKKYLQKINKQHQICLIIDLHGHSRAFNSFFYGVSNKKNKYKQNSKIFPYFCSKKMKQISFLQCCFNVSQQKKNTARAVLTEIFPKALVYVLQNSFYGYKVEDKSNKQNKIVQYTQNQLRKLGSDLISAYLQYVQMDFGSQNKNMNTSTRTNNFNKQALQRQIDQFQRTMQNTKYTDTRSNADQSDSEAEDDLLDVINVEEIIKKQIQQEKEKQNTNVDESKRRERKMKTSMNEERPKRQMKKFAIKKQGKGCYLKTIEMVDTSRQELNDDYYLHKYVKDREKLVKSKPKKMACMAVKTQQGQNSSLLQMVNGIESKKQTPLLSVNVIKPSKILTPFSVSPFSISQNANKQYYTSGIKYINDKELALSEIRMKRNSQEIHRRNLRNNTINIVKKKINNYQINGIEIDKLEYCSQTRDKFKKMNVQMW